MGTELAKTNINKIQVIKDSQPINNQLKWFTFDQNNSGGFFIENDVVAEYVCIQALSARQAIDIAKNLFEPYSNYCSCCGERWIYWIDDNDGKDQPEIYDVPVFQTKKSLYREKCILHYADGKIERVIFQD